MVPSLCLAKHLKHQQKKSDRSNLSDYIPTAEEWQIRALHPVKEALRCKIILPTGVGLCQIRDQLSYVLGSF